MQTLLTREEAAELLGVTPVAFRSALHRDPTLRDSATTRYGVKVYPRRAILAYRKRHPARTRGEAAS